MCKKQSILVAELKSGQTAQHREKVTHEGKVANIFTESFQKKENRCKLVDQSLQTKMNTLKRRNLSWSL